MRSTTPEKIIFSPSSNANVIESRWFSSPNAISYSSGVKSPLLICCSIAHTALLEIRFIRSKTYSFLWLLSNNSFWTSVTASSTIASTNSSLDSSSANFQSLRFPTSSIVLWKTFPISVGRISCTSRLRSLSPYCIKCENAHPANFSILVTLPEIVSP